MSNDPEYRLFRVVGIRTDGMRVPMGCGLSSDEAKRIREALTEANVFVGIQIEMDTDPGPAFLAPVVP